jgi:hypothetical protein
MVRIIGIAIAVPFMIAIGLFLILCATTESLITGEEFILR